MKLTNVVTIYFTDSKMWRIQGLDKRHRQLSKREAAPLPLTTIVNSCSRWPRAICALAVAVHADWVSTIVFRPYCINPTGGKGLGKIIIRGLTTREFLIRGCAPFGIIPLLPTNAKQLSLGCVQCGICTWSADGQYLRGGRCSSRCYPIGLPGTGPVIETMWWH